MAVAVAAASAPAPASGSAAGDASLLAAAAAVVGAGVCGNPACGNVARTMCGRCKVEKYCSPECQRLHWRVHKKVCKSVDSPVLSQTAVLAARRRVPLCGYGYRQWLEHLGELRGTGPQLNETPVVGLLNQAQDCYLNAVLQCLVHVPMLRHNLQAAVPDPAEAAEWPAELSRFFLAMHKARTTRKPESTSTIARMIARNKEFVRGKQADAHEAFMHIVSQLLHGCLVVGDGSGKDLTCAKYSEKELLEQSSLVGHVFGMDLGQTVRCGGCNYESTTARVEYCLCVSVSLGMTDDQRVKLQREASMMQQRHIQQDSHYRTTSYSSTLGNPNGRANECSAPDTTVDKLLREFTSAEKIDAFWCGNCERSRTCTRSAHVARRPNVLLVYIDRRQDTGLFGKINRRVRFEQRLDLSPYVSAGRSSPDSPREGPSNLYSLLSIVVHRDVNQSTFFGHYVAYVRDRHNIWYLLDDQRVEQVSWTSVKDQHAYLLLYGADEVILPAVLQGVPSRSESSTGTPPSAAASTTSSSAGAPSEPAPVAQTTSTSPAAIATRAEEAAEAQAEVPAAAEEQDEAAPAAPEEEPAPGGQPTTTPVAAAGATLPKDAAEEAAVTEHSQVPEPKEVHRGAGGELQSGNGGMFDFDELDHLEACL